LELVQVPLQSRGGDDECVEWRVVQELKSMIENENAKKYLKK